MKSHAGRQHLLEREHLLIGIKCELIPAAFRSLNDDLNSILEILIDWRQARRVGENSMCNSCGHVSLQNDCYSAPGAAAFTSAGGAATGFFEISWLDSGRRANFSCGKETGRFVSADSRIARITRTSARPS